MFITKKHIPRRIFLQGMGVSVALPLLESMLPAQTLLKNTAANPTSRFGFVYVPHGMIMGEFTPATEGANFEITNICPAVPMSHRHCTPRHSQFITTSVNRRAHVFRRNPRDRTIKL